MKKIMSKIWSWITWPYIWYKEEREFKKKMEEIKKRDPFIYK